MNGAEALPLVLGFVSGLILGRFSRSVQIAAGVPLALGIGLLATVGSGESLMSWGFLSVDVPAAAAAIAGAIVIRGLAVKASTAIRRTR